jgi:hypothetical protein
MIVRTISYVSKGTELNIFYLSERKAHLPTDQRRSLLARKYDFSCGCSRCDVGMTADTAGVSRLTLLKRQRSERLLEAMKCPLCVQQEESEEEGLVIPVDDHRNFGRQPMEGWWPCTTCKGETEESDMNNTLVACYQCVNEVTSILPLPSNLDHSVVSSLLDQIHTTTEWLNQRLHVGHWLSCRLHDAAYEMTRTLSVRCRRYQELANLYEKAVTMCAIHARICIMAWKPILPTHSHMVGHLYQRAEEAINAEAGLLDSGTEEEISLRKEAMECGKLAYQVLSDICGLYGVVDFNKKI